VHPALAHKVLADALGHYLSIGPDVLPRAYRGANALSEDDGAYWWIHAAQDAAGRNQAASPKRRANPIVKNATVMALDPGVTLAR